MTDMLGRGLSRTEAELLRLHRDLARLAEDDDLSPCVAANLADAVVSVGLIVSDLGLAHGYHDDHPGGPGAADQG